MKKLYQYLLVALTVLMPMTLWADDDPFDTTHKLFRDKHVTSNPDGTYTLDLETYATGYTKQTESYVATDFVLVLDRSGSMSSNYLRGDRITSGTLNSSKDYQIVIGDKCYNLHWVSGTGWQKCYNGTSPIATDPTFSTTENYAIKSTDEIYALQTKNRLAALKEAAQAFVKEVYANNPKEAGTQKHRVSVVWYAEFLANYNKTVSTSVSDFLPVELVNTTVRDNLVSAIGSVTKDNPVINSSTYCNLGLDMASQILNASGVSGDGRNKVVVFFTDGEPGKNAGTFTNSTAREACATTYSLKTSPTLSNNVTGASGNSKIFKPVIYSVGIMDSHTAYKHGTGSGLDHDKYRFMHYVSSNYTYELSSSYKFDNDIETGKGSEDPHDYFIRSYGPDLTAAFEKIASRELKDRNEDLTASKTVVKDVMSDNFRLPKGTDASKIKLFTCDADKNNKTILTATPVYKADKVVWRTTGDAGDPSGCLTVYKDADNKTIWKTGDAGSAPVSYDHKEYWKPLTLPSGSVTVDVSTKTVSVTNYDYVKNFVGPIHDFTGATNDIAGWTGQKLIMEFVIEKEPSCPGGGTLDTNAEGSGVYVMPSTTPLSSYPVPDVGIPNIEVVVKGLTSSDGSAVFEIVKVTDATGETIATTNPYKATVVLSSANHTAELVSVGYGYYKVTQKTWDWKHTVKYDGDSDGTPETDGTSYVLHMEDPGSGTKPDKITFTFGNALKSGTLPDSDEKSVNNIFKP